MTNLFISSLHNPKIKNLLLLQQKSSERRAQNKFIAEGKRELSHCIDAGLKINSIFYCPSILGKGDNADILTKLANNITRYEVSEDVYNKLAYRENTEGILAEVFTPNQGLENLEIGPKPLIIVMESVEKPGNLGAILRSADACGADAVIVCDPLTDLYNPNLIRSSIGAIFTVPCIACSSEECIEYLKRNHIQILTAQLQDSSVYYDTDMTSGTAIVVGTESTGLSNLWRDAADKHIRIPMRGKLDSLNVSVSAAILLFEALRQRNG